jgi:hypothetical protein
MKVKTSVTLSEALLAAMDRLPGARRNRSDFLEAAAWALIKQMERDARDARDAEIINNNAERLNAEAMDVLEYQEIP